MRSKPAMQPLLLPEGNTVSVHSEGAVFYTFSESNNQIVDGNFTAPALTKSYTQNDQPSYFGGFRRHL